MRLGTRGSPLALAQAGLCAAELKKAGQAVEIVILKTAGDRDSESPLSASSGTGLFTKELEEALLSGGIDAAVHSLKDLPTQMAKGLRLAAISPREDWRDAWISATDFAALPQGALVGTGSPRRRAQLSLLRADLVFGELRGNVDTRLKKISQGQASGAVLAAAGLSRLGRLSEARSIFSEGEMLPAPGQGFLGLQCRENDPSSFDTLQSLNDNGARDCAEAERSFLDRLGAGCHAPVAALAELKNGRLDLRGFTQNRDKRVFKGRLDGAAGQGPWIGVKLAEILMGQGAELSK
jgi:hydroxymethylbilane synthase